jgi:cbb3-type cytochrome oxidase subunit 3
MLFPAPGENTFTPASTIIFLAIALIVYWFGKKKETKLTQK